MSTIAVRGRRGVKFGDKGGYRTRESGVGLEEVAEELYGLLPQEFTRARDDRARRARAEGQRELAAQIRALHRPTLAAWASNLLVREQREEIAPLLRLGGQLRDAHRSLDGEELRALSRQQHQLVDALTRQAGRLASDAGVPLGPQARQELAQTLQAVLADPGAAEEWAAGRLVRPLSVPVGFEAAAREAAAAPSGGKRARRDGGHGGGSGSGSGEEDVRARRRSREAAAREKAEAREAADAARRARREADAATSEAESARSARVEAEERHDRLRGELREAERARSEARTREREAVRAERAARHAAEEAEGRARRRQGTVRAER